MLWTVFKILGILPAQIQCFLADMPDTGNILQYTSLRFQQEKFTVGECKKDLMVAIGQLTVLLDSQGKCKNKTFSNAFVERDRSDVLGGLICEFASRDKSLKSSDQFSISGPSTWLLEIQELLSFVKTM